MPEKVHLVRAEDVLPLVEQPVEHALRQAAHQQVALHRVVQVRLEALHLRDKGTLCTPS